MMALYGLRIQQIKRSAGRSAVAAAAYRSGERLYDERQDMVHDYTRRTGVERTEIMLPSGAPAWVQGITREALWNAVEAGEKRKDAQVARELWVTIPRELSADDRITVMRDFVSKAFVSKGMIADIAWHCPKASDGFSNPHAHIMLTMRPLTETGFGKKSRHDWVPDPEGRTHADGRPVMVESNPESWNTLGYFEKCREEWENTANAALERAGSPERIDRRSFLERGLSRLPEPMLLVAGHMRTLYGAMRERFGQFQMARHYRAVEERANAALTKISTGPDAAMQAMRTAQRFADWIDRQINRLDPERAPPREPPTYTPDMER